MGTRRRSEFRDLVKDYRRGRKKLRRMQKQIDDNMPARVIVGTGIGVLAASNPYVGGAMTAYKVGKTGYEISQSYQKTYQRTKSPKRARQAAIKTATGQAKDYARDQAISYVVDYTLPRAASRSGREIMASPLARSFARNALKEVIPKWE